MKYFLLFSLVFSLFACEKNIDFKLQESAAILVVDGEIEAGKQPRIILTKSFNYYSQLSADVLLNAFVHNAEISISHNNDTLKLKEYSFEIFPGVNGYYYSIDTANGDDLIGGFDQTYQMKIIAEGKTYFSSTKIPALVNFPDSVFFNPAPFNPDTLKRIMKIKVSEEPGLGNYIRYYTKKNNEPFYPGFNSVFSDEVIDGSTFIFQLEPGVNRNNLPKPGDNFFQKGDTVTLKYSNISKPTFDFWSTWEFAAQSIGNPFAQPNKVIGNISNGALGAFCGYASWQRTFVLE